MSGARLVRVVAVAPAVLAVTLAQLGLPSPSFWIGYRILLYIAVALFMVTAIHEIASFVSYYGQLEKLREFDRNIRAVLSAGISGIESAAGVHWKTIGVTAYSRRRRWRFKRLAVLEDLRLGNDPMRTRLTLKPGKGVVGLAYSSHAFVCEDWEKYFKEAFDLGKVDWEKRPYEERFGLSWGELVRSESPTWIAAFPVFSLSGRIIGAVAVDAPANLSGPRVAQVVRNIAAAMGNIGEPPNSWWSFVARRDN